VTLLPPGPAPCPAWPLPGLAPELVSLCNRLSARELRLDFNLAQALEDPAAMLYIIPDLSRIAGGQTSAQDPAEALSLTLRLESEVWNLRLNRLALARVLGAAKNLLPAGAQAEELPPELRLALFSLCLEPCLQQASAAIGLAITLEDLEFAPKTPAENTFILPFDLLDANAALAGKGEARIPLSPASLRLLLNLSRALPAKNNSLAGLKIPFSLIAGQDMFSLKLLQAAEAGDILLFDQAWQPDYGLAEISGQAYGQNWQGWQGKLASNVFTLTAPIFRQNGTQTAAKPAQTTNKETSMANTENQASQSASGATPGPAPADGRHSGPANATDAKIDINTLNELEVRLTLELEERLISLKELAGLAPGYTFVTAASAENPVTLKINGKAVGRGQLVDVDGRLGVLVSTFNPAETVTE
jgi:type III secretion protein Q